MRSCPLRFVRNETDLGQELSGAKQRSCPHCNATGALNGHGPLRGYDALGNSGRVRGHRLFCSNRGNRPGCGRTVSIWLGHFAPGFSVRTGVLFRLLMAVLQGTSTRGSFAEAEPHGLSERSGYRLFSRLQEAQSRLRTRLSERRPPPPCSSAEPLSQLVSHFGSVFGRHEDLFQEFQCAFQMDLFAPSKPR